jgi:hypothetical protein
MPDASVRMFLFVSAEEPLVAAQAVWAAPTAVDLCVSAPSAAARDAVAFACAGRAVRMIEEPLLGAPRPDEDAVEIASRTADALRALYALVTRSALVVWDMLDDGHPCPMLLGENELLHEAEQIERDLPFP